ncbi:dipeptidase [Sinomicrobium weinanense]|uniref:Dipeptidase n=1 Tax=Sinomicrobium weinanense TaxID=2842200 RepID=A0A926JNS5_9FLAO|nr:dipeptidase [Sinomicrobium weinanense]MBC9794690.1 dipeptidase [Sinomicrobium weinanense]MBU3124175.1 dipeptidase [Sinomicrobium weinanense]
MDALQLLKKDKHQFINELMELLRIKSISTDVSYKSEITRAADYLKNKLKIAGVDFAEVIQTNGHPIVYAEKINDPSMPTVLVYGHYDVQPPDPVELWESPPFEPEIRNGKIHARGASDDKGQLYIHIKAFEILMRTNSLKCNVKFLIEGEEEIGSINLRPFVRNNKEKLACDTIIVSDTAMIDSDTPSITVGLRGMSYLEVELTGANRDLHSGIYGGAVPNPINELCRIIASLHDEDGKINISGFYNQVLELSEEQKKELQRIPFNAETYKSDLGLKKIKGENGYTTIERIGYRPTLDVNGIWAGYTGEGKKTVIPAKAFAKISARLVPNQSSEEISKLIISHLKRITPEHLQIKVKKLQGSEFALMPADSDASLSASKAFEKAWGKKPIHTRGGGGISIVTLFQNELNIDPILMGFGLDEDALHSPNESFSLYNFTRGIETVLYFYKYYSDIYKNDNTSI